VGTDDGPETSGTRGLDVLSALAEDRGRIAHDLNDTLISQMFAVSLDLHAALARIDPDIDDLRAAEKIRRAISGLDRAIKDLRNIVMGNSAAPVDFEQRSHTSDP
jgi:signal transduction histidine kinase